MENINTRGQKAAFNNLNVSDNPLDSNGSSEQEELMANIDGKQTENSDFPLDAQNFSFNITSQKPGHPNEPKFKSEVMVDKLNNQVHLIENRKYQIIQSYEANEEREVTVFERDEVYFKSSCDGRWALVYNCRTNKTGLIPIEKVGGEINESVPESSQSTGLDSGNIVSNRINHPLMKIFTLIVMILGAFLSLVYRSHIPQVGKRLCDLPCEISKLENAFVNQSENLWLTLESCLDAPLSGKFPCIITLLNENDDDLTCLHRSIGEVTFRLFNVPSNKLVVHKGSEMDPNEFSYSKYKSELKEHSVLLISEMEQIPGDILVQFHSLCDIYDPAVTQAVIVFMLNFKHIKLDMTDNNDNTLAVSLVNEHWKNSIHHDLINALAIRITENAVRVHSEKNMVNC